MAELAGLVLGGLPLAIWALEKYSEPFETFHRYRTTIESFRSQIIIQNYQLEKTLSNIGLGKNASREELQKGFEAKFPQISRELIFIVRQMDEVTMELIKSLDVSIDTKNWSRVKNSLNTKKRNKVLESLRHWNENLRRVVEKTELPEEDDSSQIQELKLRFNPQRCSSIRKCLGSLHRALGAGLCCACPSPHQAAVGLDWKAYESDEMQVYKVAVSYKKNAQPSQHIDSWKKLHIAPDVAPELTAPHPNLLAPVSPPRTPSPTSLIKSKIVRFASFSSLRISSPSPKASRSVSVVTSVARSIITSRTEVTNLCDAVCAKNIPHNMAGYFKDPEKDPSEKDHRRFLLDPNQPDLFKITEAFQLKSLISLGHLPAGKQNPIHSLSAKQRYGIAASIAWVIFALGVILVELCMIDLQSGSLIDDYRTAVSRLDEVRRIAGSAYGDAAERCIKFSFPGRDMYKNFDVLQFRKKFYDDVVAPVQAAYYLMPG
ncbi:hypothetical protein E0Z10_g6058 [Xylaria hypoxylon]|uniref:Prion-inhibition and propagation HeLo domain-containing protein n=1 Tax=Xylaria hypoxylon TaxID=37992 RepID=A0A4Z0YRV1_9PEZI|nr:hypothetical protein E0Z10_g6058 [Xylaria hypoxylon]